MFLSKFYQTQSGKMLPSFSDKFSHFQYATLEIFKAASNNYSVLKLRFLINNLTFAMYCKNVSHQYYATNQDTKPHILWQNCPKIGVDQYLSFFICHSFFYYAGFFPLKGKLKDIIHFPYKISNDIIQCCFFLSGFSFTDTDNSQGSRGRRGPSFIPLYHFDPLTNIQTFICNFAREITITCF